MRRADMGAVVIGDGVSAITRYPHKMAVGDVHQGSSTDRERQRASSVQSQGSQASASTYGHHRYASASAETNPSDEAPNLGRTSSHTPRSSTPIAIPPGRGNSQQRAGEAAAFPEYHFHPKPVYHSGLGDDGDGFDRSGFPLNPNPRGLTTSSPPPPSSPQLLPTLRSSLSLSGSGSGSPNRIKVRDLNHIQTFASEEVLTRSTHGSRRSLRARHESGQQYEISSMPVTDIIEMVAGLLTKITTTNDRQHENIHRHIPPHDGTSVLSQQTASVLSFHGKNVPSITILSYLSRIHKYCPTTYEVFLSLLVYFDRMTENINSGTLSSFHPVEEFSEPASKRPGTSHSVQSDGSRRPLSASIATPPSSGTIPPQDQNEALAGTGMSKGSVGEDPNEISKYFVVDSFNIHRLVIAGVTCASKFFSDVFYTNSRYAKVGGLPINELNHLELQFLLLNDFRLNVPVEELEAYGSMLVEFYAKEVVAQQMSNSSITTDALYMHARNPTSP